MPNPIENKCEGCGLDLSLYPDDWEYTCAYCEEKFCKQCLVKGKMAHVVDSHNYDMEDDEWFCKTCAESYEPD